MAELVIDSSVAVKWFLPELYSLEACRILDEYQSGTISLLAPDLINAEIGNIIWKKQVLQGLDADDAQAVWDGFRALQFTSFHHQTYLTMLLNSQSSISEQYTTRCTWL